MIKHRRMNFNKDHQKPGISPWLVLFLMLVGLVVAGVLKP